MNNSTEKMYHDGLVYLEDIEQLRYHGLKGCGNIRFLYKDPVIILLKCKKQVSAFRVDKR
jgi:hypothetical protein